MNKYNMDEQICFAPNSNDAEVVDILNDKFGLNLVTGDLSTLLNEGAAKITGTSCQINLKACRSLSMANKINGDGDSLFF